MGEVLTGPQVLCQDHGAALILTHHWNKTGTGSGAQRMRGVGPTAWGRVLGSGEVIDDRREGLKSIVEIAWEFTGSEIPPTRFGVTRTVWVEDPQNLASPMHYEVEVMSEAASLVRVPPSERRVREAMEAEPTRRFTRGDLERLTGLHKNTVKQALASLGRQNVVESDAPRGRTGEYWIVTTPTADDES